ncbi:MAG: TolC family protein, partial [Desulfobacterales bacterium]|nr:TolC family protein [Desulfobacterales bacterium]
FNAFIVNAEALNFEQIKQKALNNNPGLSAGNSAVKAAEAEILQAGAILNPELEISSENFGENAIEVVLTQPVEIGGKRNARIQLARKALRAAELENDATRLGLEAEIIRRCVPILGLQKKIAVLDSLASVMGESLTDIKRRIQAGAAMEADALRTEMELDELLMEKAALNRQLNQQKKELAALWGNTDDADIQLVFTLNTAISLPQRPEILKKIHEHPEGKLLKLNQETAAAEIRQLKAEAFPELAISAGYLRNNEDDENAVIAGMSISLPLFNRNKGAILSKGHEVTAAGKKFQAFFVERTTKAGTILSEIENTTEAFSVLTEKLQPKAKNVYALLERYYKYGNISILEVLESRRNLLEINLRRIDLITENALLAADLMEL